MPSQPEFYKPDGQLNWESIRKDYESKCSPEELEVNNMSAGDLNTMTNKKNAAAAVKKISAKFSSQVPIDTRVQIVAAYSDGKTIPNLAKDFTLSPITVRRICVAAGVYDAERDKSRKGIKMPRVDRD